MANKTEQNRFIALLPSPHVQQAIADELAPIKLELEQTAPINWVLSLDYHVTVGYLYRVQDSDIELLIQALESIHPSLMMQQLWSKRPLFLGRALTLALEPRAILQNYYDQIQNAVLLSTSHRYSFATPGEYLPHMTLGKRQAGYPLNGAIRLELIRCLDRVFNAFQIEISILGLYESNPDQQSAQRYHAVWSKKLNE